MKRGNILIIFAIISVLILTTISAQPLSLFKQKISDLIFLEPATTWSGYGCDSDEECPEGMICEFYASLASEQPKMPNPINALKIVDRLSNPFPETMQNALSKSQNSLLTPLLFFGGVQMSAMQLASDVDESQRKYHTKLEYYYSEGMDSPEMDKIADDLEKNGYEVERIHSRIPRLNSPVARFVTVDDKGEVKSELGRASNLKEFKTLLKAYFNYDSDNNLQKFCEQNEDSDTSEWEYAGEPDEDCKNPDGSIKFGDECEINGEKGACDENGKCIIGELPLVPVEPVEPKEEKPKTFGERDYDFDGINNSEDDDIDGDGIKNKEDKEPCGWWDLDCDGLNFYEDDDLDGDNIPNEKDDDMDGDGIPNEKDDDTDGDGIPNDSDKYPNGDDKKGKCVKGERETTPPTEPEPVVEPLQEPEPAEITQTTIEEPELLPPSIEPPKPIPPPGPVEYTDGPVISLPIEKAGIKIGEVEFHPSKRIWEELKNSEQKLTKKQIYDALKDSGMKTVLKLKYDDSGTIFRLSSASYYLFVETFRNFLKDKISRFQPDQIPDLVREYEPSLIVSESDLDVLEQLLIDYSESDFYMEKGMILTSKEKAYPWGTEVMFVTDPCKNPSIEIWINHKDNINPNNGAPLTFDKGKSILILGKNGQGKEPNFKFEISDPTQIKVFNKLMKALLLFEFNKKVVIESIYNQNF